MKFITLMLALLLASLLPIPGDGLAVAQQGKRAVRVQGRQAADSRQRVALVIGNSQYRNISALRNPQNDARDMAAALERSGFQVTLLLNGTRKRMNQAIRSFGDKLRKGGVGLFFYAGHGVQLDGVNYLIPIGADIRNEDEVEDEAVSANRVMRKMKSAGNDLNMVFLDACRNNPYKGSFRSANRGLAAVMNAPKGSLISYATGAGNVAADGSGRNGTYTKNLLAAINTPNLELSQMMKRVRTGVQRDTNDEQTPYELSSLTGNFYFQGGPVAPRQTVVQTQPLPGPALTINAEESLWKAIENSKDILDFQDYLAAFPSGRFVVIARIKIRRLKRAASPRPVPRTPVAKIIPPANNRGRRDPASGMRAACYTVESSKGWQTFNVPPGPLRIASISGSWSVDRRNYRGVGPEGHLGSAARNLAPYDQYKFNRAFPFGALLVGENKTRYRHVRGRGPLPFRGRRIWMRINDQDRSLGDNGGRLRVCFKSVPKEGKPEGQSIPQRAAITPPGHNRIWRDPVTGMPFVYVPGGSFRMGCHANAGVCRSNEKPVRTVRLDGFWLGKHEVTQGQWKRIMGNNPSNFKKGDTYPVEKVSWNDVQRFIHRLNRRSPAKFRLPSEAQWEYACRSGGKPVTFGTGNDRVSPSHANYNKSHGITTTSVGKFQANALGLKDMSGNVLEWVRDRYTKYGNVGTNNPIYERSGNFRVMRGGNWYQPSGHMRCSRRLVFNPSNGTLLLGFRLLRIR